MTLFLRFRMNNVCSRLAHNRVAVRQQPCHEVTSLLTMAPSTVTQLAVLGAFWNLNLLSILTRLSVSLVAQESNKILNSILKTHNKQAKALYVIS